MKPQIVSILISLLILLLAPLTGLAEVYRVVDEHGNVTYTDQPPGDGSEPMELPELSVIETETPAEPTVESPLKERENEAKTLHDLRQMYGDFRILQPLAEETFWGTANAVTVIWGGKTPLQEGVIAMLYVDGVAQDVTGSSSTSLLLNRGEHTIYLELISGDKKKIRTTPTVTFFIKQASLGYIDSLTLPIGA